MNSIYSSEPPLQGRPTFIDDDDEASVTGRDQITDEEFEDNYADETKAMISSVFGDVFQLNKVVYNKTVAAEIVQKYALRRFNKDVSKKIFKFKINKFYNLINIKRSGFIKKLQLLEGKFCQYEDEVSTIVKKDCVYIVRIEARYDSVIVFLNIYAINQEIIFRALNDFSNLFLENQGKDDIYCELCWLIKSDGRVEDKYVKEKLNDVLYKEAYPYIDIDSLIDSYLKGDEPILVLTGPPGTGKTRLIRHILKKISMRKCGNNDLLGGYDSPSCKAMYTCNADIIEEGKLFIDFLTEDYDALVLEDIDNHLRPRTDGNTAMYGLLSSSNGLMVSTINSKKIILSTNLPGIDKIDEALIRPGRCFNIIQTRKLTFDEARKFLDISGNEDKILPENKDEFALSELYHLIKYSTTETKYSKKKRVGF